MFQLGGELTRIGRQPLPLPPIGRNKSSLFSMFTMISSNGGFQDDESRRSTTGLRAQIEQKTGRLIFVAASAPGQC